MSSSLLGKLKTHISDLGLVATLFLYTVLSLYQLDLPGLHYDEAFEAVPALQILRSQPVTPFRGSSIVLGGQQFPLMTQDYIGAINTYTILPFIYMLGPTPAALRLPSIIVGAITLGLAYALSYHLTGSRHVGLATALLLAVDPTFVFWNRQGIFVTAITAALGLGATLCWLQRLRGESMGWSVAGAFLFGLGIYAKLLFVWLIAALVGAMLPLTWPKLPKNRVVWLKQIDKKEFLLTVLALILGCWPLILYNIQTGGTILNISQNAQTSYYGVDNFAFGANLIERFKQFLTLLDSGHLWYLGDLQSNPLYPVVFGLIFILVILTSIAHRFSAVNISPVSTKIALFPFLVIALVILASIQTVSALWVTHFALLMPWPAIAIAIGSRFIMSYWAAFLAKARWSTQSLPRLIALIGLVMLTSTNLCNTIHYHLVLTKSGGLGAHSDAIYDLSDWLANHANRSVVAMDWGLAAPVIYLTNGQVTPVEVFGYAWEPNVELSTRLETFIDQPNTFYLWRAPDEIIFDRSGEFKVFYRPLNLEETIEEAFYERSGRPILGVTRLVEKGTAENPPQ